MAKKTVRNVIVFGETGSGKSSVINMVLRNPRAPVSSKAQGCTFESKPYKVTIKYQDYNLYDTAGLGESKSGTVDGSIAIGKLYKLVNELSKAGGVHLLVLVMKCGRITQSKADYYKFFKHGFCESEVPTAIVLTACENDDPNMDAWWMDNKESFTKADMHFDGHASVCADNGRMLRAGYYANEDLVKESVGLVENLIEKHSLETGWVMRDNVSWFKRVLNMLLNLFSGRTSGKYSGYSELHGRLVKCGISDQFANFIIDAVRESKK